MNIRCFGFALLAMINAGACGSSPRLSVSENDAAPTSNDPADDAAPTSNHAAPDDAPSSNDPAPDANNDENSTPDASDAPDTSRLCRGSPERRPTIVVTLPDGTREACDGLHRMGAAFNRTLTGVVRDDQQDPSSRNSLTIDTCDSGCDVVVRMTGSIPFAVPAGAYVEATYAFDLPFGCTQVLRISNLPEWNGHKNPVSEASGLYLWSLPVDCDPVKVQPQPCGSGYLRSYAFRFSHASTTALKLNQTEEAPWSLNGQPFMVRNHESFDPATCDNWFEWGFSIAAR